MVGHVFHKILGPAERSLVGEGRGHRNKWAHQEGFSCHDACWALDSVGRHWVALSVPQAEDRERLSSLKLRRVRFDKQPRGERRKQAGTAIVISLPAPDTAGSPHTQADEGWINTPSDERLAALCESTVWGIASGFDRQIFAGAMPVPSATPFIPTFRSCVIRSGLSPLRTFSAKAATRDAAFTNA